MDLPELQLWAQHPNIYLPLSTTSTPFFPHFEAHEKKAARKKYTLRFGGTRICNCWKISPEFASFSHRLFLFSRSLSLTLSPIEKTDAEVQNFTEKQELERHKIERVEQAKQISETSCNIC